MRREPSEQRANFRGCFQTLGVYLISGQFGSIGKPQSRFAWRLLTKRGDALKESVMVAQKEFERAFGMQNALLFNSGRAALTACFRILKIQSPQEVLFCGFTCAAVPTAILAAGAVPRCYDLASGSFDLSPQDLLRKITPRTKAVILQHTLAANAKGLALLSRLRAKGLWIIEDCSLALGSRHRGRPLGSAGDFAVFSFEVSKTVSCGWGGCLVVNHPSWVEPSRRFWSDCPEEGRWQQRRQMGQVAMAPWLYSVRLYPRSRILIFALMLLGLFRRSTPGRELKNPRTLKVQRMGSLSAALLAFQIRNARAIFSQNLRHLRSWQSFFGRKKIRHWPARDKSPGNSAVCPRIMFLANHRRKVMKKMAAAGVEAGLWFDRSPLESLPQGLIPGAPALPGCQAVFSRVVNLPLHPKLDPRKIGGCVLG